MFAQGAICGGCGLARFDRYEPDLSRSLVELAVLESSSTGTYRQAIKW